MRSKYYIVIALLLTINLSAEQSEQVQLKSLPVAKLIEASPEGMRLAMLYSIAAFNSTVSYNESDPRNTIKGIHKFSIDVKKSDGFVKKVLKAMKMMFLSEKQKEYLNNITLYWPQKHYLIGWNQYSGKIINETSLLKSIELLREKVDRYASNPLYYRRGNDPSSDPCYLEAQIIDSQDSKETVPIVVATAKPNFILNPYNLEAQLLLAWNYKELGNKKEESRKILRKITAASWVFEKDMTLKNDTIHPNRSYYVEASEYLIEILDKEQDALEIKELQKNRKQILAKLSMN